MRASDPWDRLPRVLRVVGKRYRTEVVGKVDADDSDGESDPVQQTILLKREQGFECARDTGMHEAVHAVDHQLHLGLTEEQVEGLGTGLLALMRDNPAFVRWLMAKEMEAKP